MRALVIVVGAFTCSGCDGSPLIAVVIDTTTISVPDELDEVHVAIAASSPAGRVCQRRTGLFNLGSASDLPLLVHVQRGSVYTQVVSYRVSGFREDALVLESQAGSLSWPASGTREVEVQLATGCLRASLESPCEAGEHCVLDRCEPLDLPESFDDPEAVDEVSCWPDE